MFKTTHPVNEQRRFTPFGALELSYVGVASALTAWSLLAVALAQLGQFRPWTVAVATVIAGAIGWGAWRLVKPPAHATPRHEAIFLAILLASGALLYGWPSEEFPQNGDASIYPNTATMLLRTGGLAYHYEPLDGLSIEEKELFYIPADEQLSDMEIQSYEGLLYGAYYVMEPDENTIVSSRPPLTIAWMGLFGMLGGERGMLYVTPLFGALSLAAVYFLGKRLFGAGAGALAALWILVSFPQLHFSRTLYAEVVGQFFVLSFVYLLVACWQTRRAAYLPLGVAALTAAFAARIDVILALPTLLLFFVQPGQLALLFTLAFLAGAGVSISYLIPWSMLPDVIELDELETGQRREGVFYGVFVFLQKLGMSLGMAASNFALDTAGYVTPVAGAALPVQPAPVQLVLRLFVSAVPAAVLLISFLAVRAYPIDRARHAEIRAVLRERQAREP